MRKCAEWLKIDQNVNSGIQNPELLFKFHLLILKVRKLKISNSRVTLGPLSFPVKNLCKQKIGLAPFRSA